MQSKKTLSSAPVHAVVTTLPIRGRWSIMVACNDYRDGSFAWRSDQFRLQCGDEFIDLKGPSVGFRWLKNALRISRWKFASKGYRQWFGNWCWDAASVDENTAVDIFRRLKQLEFGPNHATESMWTWFESL